MLNFESQHDADLFQLSGFLDGDLDATAADAVRERLAADAEFARAFEQLRRSDQVLRRATSSMAELDWAAFSREATRRRVQSIAGRRRLRLVRMATPLAAAAVLAICGTLYFSGRGGRGSSAMLAEVEPLRMAPWDDPALAAADVLDVRVERAPLALVAEDVEVVPLREAPSDDALASSSRHSSLSLVAAGIGAWQDDSGADASPYF